MIKQSNHHSFFFSLNFQKPIPLHSSSLYTVIPGVPPKTCPENVPGTLWASVRQVSAWVGKALTTWLPPDSGAVLCRTWWFLESIGFGWFLDQFLVLMGGIFFILVHWTPNYVKKNQVFVGWIPPIFCWQNSESLIFAGKKAAFFCVFLRWSPRFSQFLPPPKP